jgi:hypothetical protein
MNIYIYRIFTYIYRIYTYIYILYTYVYIYIYIIVVHITGISCTYIYHTVPTWQSSDGNGPWLAGRQAPPELARGFTGLGCHGVNSTSISWEKKVTTMVYLWLSMYIYISYLCIYIYIHHTYVFIYIYIHFWWCFMSTFFLELHFQEGNTREWCFSLWFSYFTIMPISNVAHFSPTLSITHRLSADDRLLYIIHPIFWEAHVRFRPDAVSSFELETMVYKK